MDDTKNRIEILLSLRREIENRIDGEIGEILRGRGRNNLEIKESIIWILEERF